MQKVDDRENVLFFGQSGDCDRMKGDLLVVSGWTFRKLKAGEREDEQAF